jgi:hypothetical protein
VSGWREALKIKGLLKLPSKLAKNNIYINQSLTDAELRERRLKSLGKSWCAAARILCISAACQADFFSRFMLGTLYRPKKWVTNRNSPQVGIR